jgi:hypothetical protein
MLKIIVPVAAVLIVAGKFGQRRVGQEQNWLRHHGKCSKGGFRAP